MEQDKQNILITTPIYYPNDDPHIGHVYTNVMSKLMAKMYGGFMSTGLDEHGSKIRKAAEDSSAETKAYVDGLNRRWYDEFSRLNILGDVWYRTSNEEHRAFVKRIFDLLLKGGFIYEDFYSGWYSNREETFYNNKEDAEKPEELQWIEEKNFFLNLENIMPDENDVYDILPQKQYAEYVISMIKKLNRRLCVSRKESWGIEIGEDRTVYVWFDALLNYLRTGDILGVSKTIHVIGKDILKFHAIYMIAILKALKIEYDIKIYVTGMLLNSGQKMSKSFKNAISVKDLRFENDLELEIFHFWCYTKHFGSDVNVHVAEVYEFVRHFKNTCLNIISRLIGCLPEDFDLVIDPFNIIRKAKRSSLFSDIIDLDIIMFTDFCPLTAHSICEYFLSRCKDINVMIQKMKLWTNRSKTEDVLYVYLYHVILFKRMLPLTHDYVIDKLSGVIG